MKINKNQALIRLKTIDTINNAIGPNTNIRAILYLSIAKIQ